MPFMSMRLLSAYDRGKPIFHTALDDLESFLWLLIWGIVYASKDIAGAKDANGGIEALLKAWSGGIDRNRTKRAIADDDWKDAVFGGLIREWLNTFRKAKEESEQIIEDMYTMSLDSEEWNGACDELESSCKIIYKEVLESGFRHLEGIKEYRDWDGVVEANSRRHAKRRRYTYATGARGAEGESVAADATAGK